MKTYSDCSSQSITSLSGVGIKTKALLSQIGIESLFDLLSMIPTDLIDKSETSNINNVTNGDSIVITGEIIKTVRTSGSRPNYILTIQAKTGFITVRFEESAMNTIFSPHSYRCSFFLRRHFTSSIFSF